MCILLLMAAKCRLANDETTNQMRAYRKNNLLTLRRQQLNCSVSFLQLLYFAGRQLFYFIGLFNILVVFLISITITITTLIT